MKQLFDAGMKQLFDAGLRRLRKRRPALRPLPDDRSPLRMAVVGLGKMGCLHADLLVQSNFYDLTSVCSQTITREQASSRWNCAATSDFCQLLASSAVDTIVIATPHLQHRGQVVAALRANVHVICEKPMAVSAADADAMIQAAQESTATLSVVSQNRFEPSYRYVKGLLDSGEFGVIRRCSIVETFWRPSGYFRSAPWRGTWAGEGGGVLVNQAPHVLDRYVWLCGFPAEITAMCDTSLHDIPVEDTATLILRHENGIQGQIHINTVELPPVARLEIACDRGRILVDNGAITLERLNGSIRQVTRAGEDGSDPPSVTREHRGGTLQNWSPDLLHRFYENFAEAVWTGGRPEVTAEDGRSVVEMMNAAQLSSWNKKHCTLPVDRHEYADFQGQVIASEQESR